MIYDCALDPGQWPATLQALRLELGFANAAISLQALPSCEVLLNVTSGIPQYWYEKMASYGPEVADQWGGEERMRTLPMNDAHVLSRVNPPAAREGNTNRYYLEWAKPQGLIDIMGIGLARDGGAIATLGLGRHADAGPIGDREVELARLFVPHLQRAVTIGRLIELKTVASTTFEAVLDTLGRPVLLIDVALRLLHANEAGHAMLTRGNPLHLRDSVLTAASSGIANALRVAVAQAARDESAIGEKGFGIPVRDAAGTVGALYVLPLRHGQFRPAIMPGAVAAIFASSAAAPPAAATDVIAALFDLTPAEARVFEHIAAGRSTALTADALGIGIATVRTHLMHLFDKIGVHRQADLVQLAASLATPA
jgi:DNA-binding CsgD family transcriptional regulator